MKLVNLRTGKVIADVLIVAEGFWDRLVGLMGQKSMPAGSALVLKPCRAIHTFLMVIRGEGKLILYINLVIAGVLAAVCTWTDAKTMTIYNRHTYPAVIIGLVYSAATAQYSHLYGALIICAVYLLFFLSGKMGGGDLKLAVALSLFLGMEPVLYGSILAGVVLMAWGFASTWFRAGLKAGVFVAIGKLPGGEVPYGAVLGPATMLVAVMKVVI